MTNTTGGGFTESAFFRLDDGERIEVFDGATIGRVPGQDIVLDVPPMSRRHASLTVRTGSWWLRDLGSKNGTFVNGQAVEQDPVCLADGDTVVLAGAVTLVFHDPSSTPIAPRIGRLSGVWIDPMTDAVWVDATRIEPPLSARQLALLKVLDEPAGRIVGRAEIVATVWADAAASGVSDEAVTALVKRLRGRLRESPLPVDHLEIVKGRGIRLNRPEQG